MADSEQLLAELEELRSEVEAMRPVIAAVKGAQYFLTRLLSTANHLSYADELLAIAAAMEQYEARQPRTEQQRLEADAAALRALADDLAKRAHWEHSKPSELKDYATCTSPRCIFARQALASTAAGASLLAELQELRGIARAADDYIEAGAPQYIGTSERARCYEALWGAILRYRKPKYMK